MAVQFELKANVNRVEVAVAEIGGSYVIEGGVHDVTHPAVIRALDDHDGVKRADPPTSKKKGE